MYKWTTYCLLFAFILILSAIVNSLLWVFLFDSIIPSKGEVWPKPRHVIPHDVIYQVRGKNPEIIATGHNCILLDKVIARVTRDLDILNGFDISKFDKSEKYQRIAKLNVLLTKPCEEYPYLGMDERYELTISTSSKLQATSIWGIIRGLETFVQLFYSENKNVFIRGETIVDYPNYEHRGLLLDTGRLFVPVYNLLLILDGMAMNKLNVFHWHICDNVYCPIKSEIFPNMSSNAQNLYTKDDVKFIVSYARERGIRVIPEFDVPGHQTALQKVFPSLFLHCNNEESAELMNPTLPETYDFLQRLLRELNTWFPDNHIHLGGDEAHPECWNNHNETLTYMKENNMSVVDLQTMFYQKLVEQLKPGMKQIVWQDVFDYGINMSTHDNIVQVWNYNPNSEMIKLLKAGYQILYSSFWYLNFEPKKYDFGNYYTQDPRTAIGSLNITSKDLLQNIKGGEACMWTNYITDHSVLLDWLRTITTLGSPHSLMLSSKLNCYITDECSRIFPKTCATAEVLWSFTNGSKINYEGWSRIYEQTSRMTKRGVPTNRPG